MRDEQLAKCPYCGNLTSFELLEQVESWEADYDEFEGYLGRVTNYYFIFQCKTCERTSIYVNWNKYPEQLKLKSLELIFPLERNIADQLPEPVRTTYLEAQKIQNVSRTSFAILTRKTLEQICIDKGAKGNDLSERIRDLVSQGVIPKKFGEMASTIRSFGNQSAHDTDNPNLFDIVILDHFLHLLAEYIYLLDSKIDEMRKRIKSPRDVHNKR